MPDYRGSVSPADADDADYINAADGEQCAGAGRDDRLAGMGAITKGTVPAKIAMLPSARSGGSLCRAMIEGGSEIIRRTLDD
jgi:hypothetical protein